MTPHPHPRPATRPAIRPATRRTAVIQCLVALLAQPGLGLASTATAPAAPAAAPGWNPDKPIRLIVPWAPGGAVDGTSRALANGLGARLRQPVIVENKPGASGMVGAAYAAASPADGYTFFMGNVDTQVVNPLLFAKTLRYDAANAFDPVIELGRVPMAVVERAGVNVRNAQDLQRLARDKPGSASYGTWGIGSTAHLAFALLEQQSGVDLNHLPYQGATPAYAALLGGHIEFALAQVPWALAAQREGKVQILGVTSAQRSTLDPSLPTLAELGFKDYAVEQWVGLFAPRGVPADLRERLGREVNAWLKTPEAQTALRAAGVEPGGGTPEQLASRQKAESVFWQRLIRARNITVENLQ
ncbi:Bug family tripartite tricarboxylate transporter substrate binding protein [Curvibacter gracilis]|uniref:Bug family tripartite tricarboxylate transporter substrate binding protein n=1 Tax=Curvibacter gracilis TaxID=230310 RepID=UPI00068774DF|nr:tripartite tricarboxylate transporter substrate binding protein [Curvibacter gracilis]